MGFITLSELKPLSYKIGPDIIVLRLTKWNGIKTKYVLNIPRQIATKAGIDAGTMVEILYDPDKSMLRAQLTKNINAFKVFSIKHRGKFANKPPSRIVIYFPYIKEAKFPDLKKPVAITEYEFNQGLTMRIPEDGRPAKG